MTPIWSRVLICCAWQGAAMCDCEPGPDGEMVCDCGDPDDGDGGCVWQPAEPVDCWAMAQDACTDEPACRWWDDGVAESPPCPEGEDCPMNPAPGPMCVPVDQWCASRDLEQCADDPACLVHAIQVCDGPIPMCRPEDDPDCAPPPDAECRMERHCGVVGWREEGGEEMPQPPEG